MAKSIGLGLIGAGGVFGTFIESALADVEGGALTAIADVNEQALARARQELHIDRAYTDWKRLLDDDHVDAVIVASPPFTQHEIASAVLQRGKALFLEKPGSLNLQDMQSLVELQRETGVPATVDYVMRWNTLLDVVRAVRHGGWLGDLRSVQFVNYAQDEVIPPHHWFWDRAKSGGIFVEHSVHFFDLYDELVGALPVSIVADHSTRDDVAPGGRQDQVQCVIVHENGVLCSYFHAFNRPKAMERQQAILAFDRGFITVHGWIADAVELQAWINQESADALNNLSWITERNIEPFRRDLHGRDVTWRADVKLSLCFGLPWDRNESYRREVAHGLGDLIAIMANPRHAQRVPLAAALRSLAVACVAAGTATIDQARAIFDRYPGADQR